MVPGYDKPYTLTKDSVTGAWVVTIHATFTGTYSNSPYYGSTFTVSGSAAEKTDEKRLLADIRELQHRSWRGDRDAIRDLRIAQRDLCQLLLRKTTEKSNV